MVYDSTDSGELADSCIAFSGDYLDWYVASGDDCGVAVVPWDYC